jgi:sialidase-1
MGKTWSGLTTVYQESGHTIGNAAPVLDDSSGIITLVFCRDNAEVFSLQSSDDGVTWSNFHNITAVAKEPQWGFTGSGPPGGIQLPSGRLVVCMYATGPGSYTIISDDGGKSWSRSQSIGVPSSGECQVAAMNVDSDSPVLIMAARSIAGRYISYSNDGGESWFNTSLDTSLNQSSIVSMTYKGVYLNTHLYLTAPHSTLRDNLSLFTSSDGGHSWSSGKRVIWPGPSGYSSLAYQKLKLYCLYERGDKGKEYWSTLALSIVSPLV